MKKIIEIIALLSISFAALADYKDECVEAFNHPNALIIQRCMDIKNEFALRCVKANYFRKDFMIVSSCANIDNTFAAECTERTYFNGNKLTIESCVEIKNKSALKCVKNNSNFLEIKSCASINDIANVVIEGTSKITSPIKDKDAGISNQPRNTIKEVEQPVGGNASNANSVVPK